MYTDASMQLMPSSRRNVGAICRFRPVARRVHMPGGKPVTRAMSKSPPRTRVLSWALRCGLEVGISPSASTEGQTPGFATSQVAGALIRHWHDPDR